MMSLSDDKQADIMDTFNTTSRYLDDILNINNIYFDTMVSQIYPSELQLNKANTSNTKAAFVSDLFLFVMRKTSCYSIKMTLLKRLKAGILYPPLPAEKLLPV